MSRRNALDLRAQQELRELLRGLARRGVSIVLITHTVADVVPEIGRVLMMREGRVAADGSRDALLTAERLSWLFGGDGADGRAGRAHICVVTWVASGERGMTPSWSLTSTGWGNLTGPRTEMRGRSPRAMATSSQA